MSVQYFGYSRMPLNLHDSFPFLENELVQAKEQFKKYTSVHIPSRQDEKRFIYTGTEINQNYQKSLLQRSVIEGLPTPINEYYNRVVHIEPREDYVIGVDMTDISIRKLWNK
jgi:hypothetical protein